MGHDPVATPDEPASGTGQLSEPTETVTVPDGVALPGPVDWPATRTPTEIGLPICGLDVVEVIEVALEALLVASLPSNSPAPAT